MRVLERTAARCVLVDGAMRRQFCVRAVYIIVDDRYGGRQCVFPVSEKYAITESISWKIPSY